MNRSLLIFFLCILPLLSGCEPPETERPNIVLVITDDQGYGDIAAHGHPLLNTPHLDALHAESVRLTDFHVDPTCSPTRAALLTGRYSTRTGVWHTIMGRSILDPDEVTLAELLREAGYRTGAFGKWHLGENYPSRPQDQGFETVMIHGGGGVGQTPDFFGNDYFDDTYKRGDAWEPTEGYCTDVWVDEAIKFINTPSEDPFFLYLPTNAAHGPFLVDSSYSNPYRALGAPDQLANFYGMVENIDDNVGRLRQALAESGKAENTIFIFMTDNGSAFGVLDEPEEGKFPGFNAGLRGRKGSAYDGGHRVPFFISWPAGDVGGGEDIDNVTAHIDVLPTLMDLIELPIPEGIDGQSLKPLFLGMEMLDRRVFVHSQRIEFPRKWKAVSVMSNEYRLVNGEELYAIQVDRDQQVNLADSLPEVVEDFRASYDTWWASLEEVFDEYVYIGVGSTQEPVTELTAHDWHTDNGPVPWHQRHIQAGLMANGFWAIDVVQAGTYEVTLRRWPASAAGPIEAVEARMLFGDTEDAFAMDANQESVTFEAELEAGQQRLQTWLTNAEGEERGAYYVTIRRI